jgi:1,4-dihydroxy-2-naphthoyl-CoA hydrolase
MTSPADLEGLLSTVPFSQTCGVELESASPEEVTGSLPWAPERCTAGGVLHGGAVMTLADTLGALCAFLNLPAGASTATLESKTNFFRGVRAGSVHGTTRPLHVGRTTIVVETDLRDDGGKRVALVIQTQAVLAPTPAATGEGETAA